jgi:hypothetical protein
LLVHCLPLAVLCCCCHRHLPLQEGNSVKAAQAAGCRRLGNQQVKIPVMKHVRLQLPEYSDKKTVISDHDRHLSKCMTVTTTVMLRLTAHVTVTARSDLHP